VFSADDEPSGYIKKEKLIRRDRELVVGAGNLAAAGLSRRLLFGQRTKLAIAG